MRYLRNSDEIKKKLHELFTGDEKKWAIVAYVGYSAAELLPENISNLSVVCWPQAGGTHPDGIRRLIDKGVDVQFCERLHQKIYHKENVGLIVGSANLSNNGLENNGQHEFAIYSDDTQFNIQPVLDSLTCKPVTKASLAKLDIEHAAFTRNNKSNENNTPRDLPDFIRACKQPFPKKWKIIPYCFLRKDDTAIINDLKNSYGNEKWSNDNDYFGDCKFEIGEFFLQIKVNDNNKLTGKKATWLLVDHIIDDKKIIVQLKKINIQKTPPPFLIDPEFMKNFKTVFNNEDTSENFNSIYDKNYAVNPDFITKIEECFGT